MSASQQSNDDKFSEQYEIRQLRPSDLDHVRALIAYSNIFHSPVWSVLHRNSPHIVYQLYLVMRTISMMLPDGHCYGVFDKQYKYKRPASAVTHGKLYWDLTDPDINSAKLLEQMDFPLVAVALAEDQFNLIEPQHYADMSIVMNRFAELKAAKQQISHPPADSVVATAAGQVLVRRGTATRADYGGRGIAKRLSYYTMDAAARQGFRHIVINSLSQALTHIWCNPPLPYRAQICCEFDTAAPVKRKDGTDMPSTLLPARQVCTDIILHLQPDSKDYEP